MANKIDVDGGNPYRDSKGRFDDSPFEFLQNRGSKSYVSREDNEKKIKGLKKEAEKQLEEMRKAALNPDTDIPELRNYDEVEHQKRSKAASDTIANLEGTDEAVATGNIEQLQEALVENGDSYTRSEIKDAIVLLHQDPYYQQFVLPRYQEQNSQATNTGTQQDDSSATDVQVIDSVNPTGGVFVDYNPQAIANAELADNMTTLDQTTGGSPDDIITVYRGVDKEHGQTEIVAGDFITDMKELAESYTGDGNVISMKVRKGDVVDDANEGGGNEYLYIPGADKKIAERDGAGTAETKAEDTTKETATRSSKAQKTLDDIENKIRSLPKEKFYAVGKNGEVIGEANGNKGQVNIDFATAAKIAVDGEAVLTHNHPTQKMKGGESSTLPFSLDDLITVSMVNAKTMRAVGETHDFEIERTDKWPAPSVMRNTHEQSLKNSEKILRKKLAKGEITDKEFQFERHNLALLETSKALGFKYTSTTRGDSEDAERDGDKADDKKTENEQRGASEKTTQGFSVPDFMKDDEEEIRNQDFETLVAYTPEGDYVAHIPGTKNRIVIPNISIELMKSTEDFIFTHNHPGTGTGGFTMSFSKMDIDFAARTNPKVLRAIGKTHDYTIVRADGARWPELSMSSRLYNKAKTSAEDEFKKKIEAGEMTKDEARLTVFDRTIELYVESFKNTNGEKPLSYIKEERENG